MAKAEPEYRTALGRGSDCGSADLGVQGDIAAGYVFACDQGEPASRGRSA
jgi:hypothetical protein